MTEEKPQGPPGSGTRRSGWIRRFLAVALGYVGAALLSHLIAGPLAPWWPVWLSSGVGLVAILVWGTGQWPGVIVGAFGAFWLLFRRESAGVEWELSQFLGCAGGAAGAVAAAIAGATLARRWAGWPSRLDRNRQVAGFFMGGALAGSAMGAAISIPVWIGTGLLPEENWFFSLAGFFLAQAVGVSATILLLVLKAGKPRSLWKRRKVSLGIPMAIALGLTVVLLSAESRSLADRIKLRFNERAGRIASAIDRRLSGHIESIESIRGFWDSSVGVDRREFRIFTEGPLRRHPGFEALGWAPEIVPGQLEVLVSQARSEAVGGGGEAPDRKLLIESYAVRKPPPMAGDGESLDAPNVCTPVYYLEPVVPNAFWLGLDLRSDPTIARAMEFSKMTGVIAVTAPFDPDDADRPQVLVCGWIERESKTGADPADWLQGQSGYAFGLLNVSLLIGEVVKGEPEFRAAMMVADHSNGAAGSIPFYTANFSKGGRWKQGIRSEADIEFSGRTWRLHFSSDLAVIAGKVLWETAAVQAVALSVTGLLGMLLLVATGHAARVEQEVRDRSRELADSEERFRQLSENIEEVFWMTSPDGMKVEYVSPAFEKIWGRPCEDLYGNISVWLEAIHPEDRSRVESAYKRVGEGDFDVEYRVVRPDETIRWIRDRGFPVRDGAREVVRIAGVADDITDRKEIMSELSRSNADLRRFAYLASHDLQEPLRMVTSFVQLLERRHGERLGDEAKEYIRHAVDGAERMRRLILGLLELSRIDSRGGKMEKIESAEIVSGALQNLHLAIKESGAEIRIEKTPAVWADPAQLTQVFQNLIGNAIKFYVKDEQGKPVVTIDGKRRSGSIEFSVSDNGPGIEPKHHEEIFQIFRRLVSHEEFEGSGMGLALCKRIVERHGGEIWVESEGDGKGAIFFLHPAG